MVIGPYSLSDCESLSFFLPGGWAGQKKIKAGYKINRPALLQHYVKSL